MNQTCNNAAAGSDANVTHSNSADVDGITLHYATAPMNNGTTKVAATSTAAITLSFMLLLDLNMSGACAFLTEI
jgi:hypothetical protein